MRIVVGSDHRGTEAIRSLAEKLRREGNDVEILGPSNGPTDYPEPAYLVAQAVAGVYSPYISSASSARLVVSPMVNSQAVSTSPL